MLIESLSGIRAEIARCIKCGACRGVCPIFRLTGRESRVARGRLAILEAGLDDAALLPDTLAGILSTCLFCGKCQENCAAGVPYLTILEKARAACPDPSLLKELIVKHLLMGGRLFPLMRAGGTLFGRVSSGIVGWPGSKRRFPVPSSRFFLDGNQRVFAARGREHGRAAFFVGCSLNCFLPGTARSVTALLTAQGFSVVAPEGQVCCGAPALFSGYPELAARHRQVNEEAFRKESFDLVVFACPTCGAHAKGQGGFADAAGKRGEARDLSEVLQPGPGAGPPPARRGAVTYHDPCHLRELQKITRQPRALVQARSALFVELGNPGACCGFGGSFSVAHPGMSGDLAAARVESIVQSRAAAVVTACPGCTLQLSCALDAAGSSCRAVHLADFLAAGLDPQQGHRPGLENPENCTLHSSLEKETP